MREQKPNCTCCGKKLNTDTLVFLELDQRINEYHDFGNIPEDYNQGGFPFGRSCAKKARLSAKHAIEKKS